MGDIIIAGEDEPPDKESSRDDPKCPSCGAELEWNLDKDYVQRKVCPNCKR